MNLRTTLSYSLMFAGTAISARTLFQRHGWDQANIHGAIMLDWDDVQAVATRLAPTEDIPAANADRIEWLLRQYQAAGATHLAIPEITLTRLLATGQLAPAQGSDPDRVYLRASTAAIADFVTTELQARLPQVQVSRAKQSLISFSGDLPTLAEVGLGFDPAHVELARQTGLRPAARPVGYSWIQPDMIDRTFNQAAALGCKIIAVQGNLVPGHEFKIQATVEAMRRNRLTYAYFSQSRHQKGDWFLAKNLASDGLVTLAHQFEPAEMLEDDWHTLSHRWANLATQAGVRVCSMRFFRVLHAADPLESVAYVRALKRALVEAGLLVDGHPGLVDLTAHHPPTDAVSLAGAGLSAAGAAGLAANLLPLPESVKLGGMALTALGLTALPFAEKVKLNRGAHHHHDDHDHGHHHHHDDHDHGHHHHHDDHDHGHHHHHDRTGSTAYASKGIALAASVAFPAAAAACGSANPGVALLHGGLVATAGGAALTAATSEADYLLDIEAYRGYNLDWLLPLGLAVAGRLEHEKFKYWPGLALTALGALAVKNQVADPLAIVDREHRHAHTHHLSAFQAALGDVKMALAIRPLRKWALLTPLGSVAGALLRQFGQADAARLSAVVTAAGAVAAQVGFRNSQRPLKTTAGGRGRAWVAGSVLAGLAALMAWLWGRRR